MQISHQKKSGHMFITGDDGGMDSDGGEKERKGKENICTGVGCSSKAYVKSTQLPLHKTICGSPMPIRTRLGFEIGRAPLNHVDEFVMKYFREH